jgi:hypothetical protein
MSGQDKATIETEKSRGVSTNKYARSMLIRILELRFVHGMAVWYKKNEWP